MTEKESLLHTLFSDPKRKHVNIKFCPGISDKLSEEALCAEARAAIFEFDNDIICAVESVEDDFPQIDIKKMYLPA